MTDFPEFATPRLALTKITSNDTAAVFELYSNAAVVQFYDLEAFRAPSQAQDIIRLFDSRYTSASGIRWAIRLRDTGELIGTCGFNSWNVKMHHASIGYDLMPDYWGRGMVTEALFKMLSVAFAGLLPCGFLHRIQADTVPGNIGSEKVLRKLGFKEEGFRRQSGFWKGSYHDLKCFGLLRPEFREQK